MSLSRQILFSIVLPPIFLYSACLVAQQVIDPIVEEQAIRLEENQKAQKEINKTHEKTLSLIDDYESNLKIVEGLHMYNSMMQKQLERQEEEIGLLRKSITDVAVIERQVLPLLTRMLDGLEAFIQLDVPFLLEERGARVNALRKVLARVDVTAAEKTRRVFEAYQIETEYGRTIESYREKIAVDGGVFDADVLRIGRVSLIYRTIGSEKMGYWNAEEHDWNILTSGEYRHHFEKVMKIANREMAPELMVVPVTVNGEYK